MARLFRCASSASNAMAVILLRGSVDEYVRVLHSSVKREWNELDRVTAGVVRRESHAAIAVGLRLQPIEGGLPTLGHALSDREPVLVGDRIADQAHVVGVLADETRHLHGPLAVLREVDATV